MLLSILIVHINAPFLDISGCARQYEQALLHSLARKLAAARHNPSKLGFCSRLAQTFVFNRRFLAMAEYSSSLNSAHLT